MLGARGSFQDRYEKIKLLGEGAFGAAYLVRPKDERHLQVAKEIRISHLTDKQREGAIAESEVLRMLKHPNIIAYINSFLEGPRMYIIMEYANGGDLGIKIKERKDTNAQFEEWEIMRIFVQLVLALTHIHARKVLHRDLKPLNVFLTLQGIVKLGDFGIARLLDSTTDGAQTTIGTPHYLSPEIVNNEAYGTRSDLWSLGVVTYELAALRVPFSGNSLPAVAMKIMGADPEPLPHRSSELNVIVFGLLSKDPAERPSLKELQNRPYVANYAKELLHYSRETGTGGCEGMTRSLEAKELVYDREDEPARPRKPGRPQDKEAVQAANAEYFRTRQAALEVKRRAEAETVAKGAVPERPELPERPERPRQRSGPKRVEESPQLTGKEREAEVRHRARAEQDERDAAHWDALNKAMRENFEERRKLELRLKASDEAVAAVDDGAASPSRGVTATCKDKLAEEAEYLQRLAEARQEQAQERRRLAEKVAARAAADDEVSASGEEVDSDKENVCLPRKRPLPDVPFARGDAGQAPMLLEIPFTDKVKPKPKLSSEGRSTAKRSIESRLERPKGDSGPDSGFPPTLRAPPSGKSGAEKMPPPGSRAESIRSELGLRTSSRSKAAPGRASGSPAQWLRSVSCDRPERSSTLEKLPPSRSRPSLDMAYSASPPAPAAPASPAPTTPQGLGDVSQLQDALAQALCGIEGLPDPIPEVPEEIVGTDFREAATVASEDVIGQMTLVSDWKDTYD